jgi:hypothetical protein
MMRADVKSARHDASNGTTTRVVVLLGAIALGFVAVWLPVRARQDSSAAGSGSEPTLDPAVATDSPAPSRPGAAPGTLGPQSTAARMQPRDPREWQGMLVSLEEQALCSERDGCGLAMACRDGRCGPCQHDEDCSRGEACVLDHCLRAENVGCRSRADCREHDAMCALNGYTGGDRRSNGRMVSQCLTPWGGRAQREGQEAAAVDAPAFAREAPQPAGLVSAATLQETVRQRIMEKSPGN